MSDVALVALFSVIGTTVVAVSSAVANLFGPAWRERAQRVAERAREREDLRYERAHALIVTVLRRRQGYVDDKQKVPIVNAAFLATLRKGEGVVADFVSRELHRISHTAGKTSTPVDQFAESLLAYLRGDLTRAELSTLRPRGPDGKVFVYLEDGIGS
jgi:hypothetical protein